MLCRGRAGLSKLYGIFQSGQQRHGGGRDCVKTVRLCHEHSVSGEMAGRAEAGLSYICGFRGASLGGGHDAADKAGFAGVYRQIIGGGPAEQRAGRSVYVRGIAGT